MASSVKILFTGSSVSIGDIKCFHSELKSNLAANCSIKIDASGLSKFDLTFIQCLISGSRAFAAKGLDFSIVGSADVIRSAFLRCGVGGLNNDQSAF